MRNLRTDERTDKETDGRTDEWVDGWMDGRTDRRKECPVMELPILSIFANVELQELKLESKYIQYGKPESIKLIPIIINSTPPNL